MIAQKQEPPFEVIGRYYDTLTPEEKSSYWRYIYGETFTAAQAEYLEKKFVSGTLHFICDLQPGDTLHEMDEWEDSLNRTLDRI